MPDTSNTGLRRPRFRRHRFGKPPAPVLQERDREIVRLVAEFGVISSAEICALVGSSEQGVTRRLQRLFHYGFLDRPAAQHRGVTSKFAYAIGQRGSHEVLGSTARTAAHRGEANRIVGVPHIEHSLMLARLRACLTLAAREAGTVDLEKWMPDGGIRESVSVDNDGRASTVPICPDGYFALRLTGELEGRNRIHVLVEADRSTMTVARFVTKLRGYVAYWQSGRQRERLGISNFIVLTVTRSRERADGLRAAAQAAPRGQWRMFLFGAEPEYSVREPARVLGPIWRTPADDALHSILE